MTAIEMKLKTAIIEGNQEHLAELLHALKGHEKDLAITGMASKFGEALSLVRKNSPDLVFMSADLKECSNSEMQVFVASLSAKVIMTGSEKSDAYKAMKTHANDFILYPIDAQELSETLDCVLKRPDHSLIMNHQGDINSSLGESMKIALIDSSGFHILETSEIIKLEAHSNYTDIYLVGNRKLTYCKMLKEFEGMFRQFSHLMRTHRSFIVNLDHVTSFSRQGIIKLTEDQTAHCGDSYKENFLHYFNLSKLF